MPKSAQFCPFTSRRPSTFRGTTGLAIIDAVLAGARDVNKPAAERDARIRANKDTMAKVLFGTTGLSTFHTAPDPEL
jgi:hypothetical protein